MYEIDHSPSEIQRNYGITEELFYMLKKINPARYDWMENPWKANELRTAIAEHPNILQKLLPLFSTENPAMIEAVRTDDIIAFVNKYPELANILSPLISYMPELIPIYRSVPGIKDTIHEQHSGTDPIIENTRISREIDIERIRMHLEKNSRLSNQLGDLILNELKARELGEAYQIVIDYYAIAKIGLMKIGSSVLPNRALDGVRINIYPADRKYQFSNYELTIHTTGIINSAVNGIHARQSGFRFKMEPYDEEGVLNAILAWPIDRNGRLNEFALSESLENIPSLYAFVDTLTAPPPRR